MAKRKQTLEGGHGPLRRRGGADARSEPGSAETTKREGSRGASELSAGTGLAHESPRQELFSGTGPAQGQPRQPLSAGTGELSAGTGGTGGRREGVGLPAPLVTLPDDDPALTELAPLIARLGHRFVRPALLRAALTTPSWVNEHPAAGWPGNACLEFLGDAVLGLVAADALWRRFPTLGEGDLTRLRASLVSEAALGVVAREIALGERLFLGRGDLKSGVLERDGTLADAVEAAIAAAFLDARASGGDPLAAAAAVFDALLGPRLRAMRPEDGVDPKSRLQAIVQARHRRTPVYATVGERPKGSDPVWRVQVTLTLPEGQVLVLAEAEAASLRAAEQAAAVAALAELDASDACADT